MLVRSKIFFIKATMIFSLLCLHSNAYGGAYNSGSQASGQQTQGMMTSLIMGGVGGYVAHTNWDPCTKEYAAGSGIGAVANQPCAIMAAGVAAVGMAVASFFLMNQADDQSRATMADAAGTPYSPAPYSSTPYSPIPAEDKVAGTQAYKDFLTATEPLKQKGYNFDLNKGTVTTPDGKTLPAGSLGTVDGLRAAGISVPDANAFQNALNDINAKAQKAVADQGGHLTDGINGDSGSGGGGPRASGISKGWADGGVFEGGGRSPSGKNGDHVAGLKKDYHGTPIGVSEDSIFDMAKRRYKLKGEQNSFLVQ